MSFSNSTKYDGATCESPQIIIDWLKDGVLYYDILSYCNLEDQL